MPAIKKEAIVPHSCLQMYELANDLESYPKFLPWCSSAQVLQRDDDEVRATLTVAGGGFSRSFTTHNRLQKNKMIEIRLVDGPFRHLEGFWLFESLDNEQCKVSLDLEFEFSGGLLDFAFGPIFHSVASTLVDAFVARAKEIYV